MSKSEITSKLDRIIQFADIGDVMETPVKRYSSGMYVRLAFAIAAYLEPDILLVDEVLAVGDADFQRKSLSKMKDAAGEGRTVLFVSHNMAMVRQLCDMAVYLEGGYLKQIGASSSVIDAYLLGSTPRPVHGERTGTDKLWGSFAFSNRRPKSHAIISNSGETTILFFGSAPASRLGVASPRSAFSIRREH